MGKFYIIAGLTLTGNLFASEVNILMQGTMIQTFNYTKNLLLKQD